MSNKTFNAKNNRAKKAISPVIATVILVAVAVVIAAALAGFSGSLFGSYSQGPQIKVKGMTINGGADTGVLTLSNSGNQQDTLKSISIGDRVINLPADVNMPANTDSKPFAFDYTPAASLVAGQQVSAVIQMQSGAQITQTVTVS